VVRIREIVAAEAPNQPIAQSDRVILAADPPKQTVVQAQTPVSLLIGAPPAPRTYVMPDLIDKPLDQVRPSLEVRGLVVSTVKFEAYPGIPDGIIIRQYPLRGAPVSSRDPITVVVSRAEDTTVVDQPPQPQPATPMVHE
jgi:beta-lactam-binding protein with PASTA domain